MEQGRRRIDQHHHFDECIRYCRVAVSRLVYVADIPVDDVRARSLRSFDTQITEILAGSNHPRTVKCSGCAPEVLTGEARRAVARTHPRETSIQYLSFDGAYGHTLSVNGIEAAHRISDDEISIGEAAHFF